MLDRSKLSFHHSPIDKAKECKVLITDRVAMVMPADPAECDYVRFVQDSEYELAYWSHTEWEEAGTEVMGAIMGLANGLQIEEYEEQSCYGDEE